MARALPRHPVAILVIAALGVHDPAHAAWPTNPGVNTPLSTAAGAQTSAIAVSDGAGGAIVAWEDARSGSGIDIYAQRVDVNGNVLWTGNGVPIVTSSGDQTEPVMIVDNSGGAIIAWTDARAGATTDIYAQHVTGSGTVLWVGNGVVVNSSSSDQYSPAMAEDGFDGAVIAWIDDRSAGDDIYAQRLSFLGSRRWSASGVPVCNAARAQFAPRVAGNNSGGGLIAWHDFRNNSHNDVYVQRLDELGAALWNGNGAPVCTLSADQEFPVLVTDGGGGAIVAWEDSRSGGLDVYAQRMGVGGASSWISGGIPVCDTVNAQAYISIIRYGGNGAALVWEDRRAGGSNGYDIYAQRMDGFGAMAWTADGVPVCTASNRQRVPALIADGASGLIVAWYDIRSAVTYDIYAQRLNASGARVWPLDGVAIGTAANDQISPVLVTDAHQGAVLAWEDRRSGTGDIYAQRVYATGGLSDATDVPSRDPGTNLTVTDGAGLTVAVEPNPLVSAATVRYTLPEPAHVCIELYDTRGRCVRRLMDSTEPAGAGRVALDERGLAPGVYLVRATAGTRVAETKLVRLR